MASDNKKPSSSEYEAVGRSVDQILSSRYLRLVGSTPQLIWRSMLYGFLVGLAGVLGATVGIAILIGILAHLHNIPGVGQVAKNISDTIQKGK